MPATPPSTPPAQIVLELSSGLVELVRGIESLRGQIASTLNIGLTEMRALARVAEAEEYTPKQLSASLDLTTGAVTALTDRLVAAELLERVAHPSDRRSLLLRPTAKGAALIRRVGEEFHRVVGEALGGIPESVLSDAARTLARVAGQLAEVVDRG